MSGFIAVLIIGIIFVAVGFYLIGDKNTGAGVVMLLFALVFFGGACGFLSDEIKKYKSTIEYDSTKHNVVQTDTTFIINNGKVDTIIHYQLTDKDFEKCKN